MKNFSFRIFSLSSLVIGLLTFISMMASWGVVDNSPGVGVFWIILAKSFFVLNWALTFIVWMSGDHPNEVLFIWGIFLNCFLNGFIIERLFSLRKKSKIPNSPIVSPSKTKIDRNSPPSENEIQTFVNEVSFKLPAGFIDFFMESNGANVNLDDKYIMLWPLTDMVRLNLEYNVSEYAPDFFLFGSNGGGESYAIEKDTGYIYEMPFIGMSKEEAIFMSKTFTEFIDVNV